MEFNVNELWQAFTAIVLASFGALVRLLGAKDKRKVNWRRILTEMICAGFIGYWARVGLQYLNMDAQLIAFICGAIGLLGINATDLLNFVMKKLGIDLGLDEKKE